MQWTLFVHAPHPHAFSLQTRRAYSEYTDLPCHLPSRRSSSAKPPTNQHDACSSTVFTSVTFADSDSEQCLYHEGCNTIGAGKGALRAAAGMTGCDNGIVHLISHPPPDGQTATLQYKARAGAGSYLWGLRRQAVAGAI